MTPAAPIKPRRGVVWILWVAAAIHIVWGPLTMIGPHTLTAPTATISGILHGNTNAEGMWYLTVGASALASLIRGGGGFGSIVAIAPQQLTLWLSMAGSLASVRSGAYPDGTTASHIHILKDQLPNIAFALGHTLALLEVYAWPVLSLSLAKLLGRLPWSGR